MWSNSPDLSAVIQYMDHQHGQIPRGRGGGGGGGGGDSTSQALTIKFCELQCYESAWVCQRVWPRKIPLQLPPPPPFTGSVPDQYCCSIRIYSSHQTCRKEYNCSGLIVAVSLYMWSSALVHNVYKYINFCISTLVLLRWNL